MIYERRKAYAEVDTVLQSLPTEYRDKIPQKIKDLFETQKLTDYQIDINRDNPIDKNKLSEMSLAILAVLNYKYWCPNNKEKYELSKKYIANNKKYENKLEKYNPNDIFKKTDIQKPKANSIQENNNETSLVEVKENFFIKFINFIKNIFKR